ELQTLDGSPLPSGQTKTVSWSPDGARLTSVTYDGASLWRRTFSAPGADANLAQLRVKLSGTAEQGFFLWAPDSKHALYTLQGTRRDIAGFHPIPTRLGEAERGTDEFLADPGVYGFNAEGSRLYYSSSADYETSTYRPSRRWIRPVNGGPKVNLPAP